MNVYLVLSYLKSLLNSIGKHILSSKTDGKYSILKNIFERKSLKVLKAKLSVNIGFREL